MIRYVIGDATNPIGDGIKIISHVCNDEDKWGKGFVLALSRKWLLPELSYHSITTPNRQLGFVQLVRVTHDIYVANMIAQHGIGKDSQGNPPIRYDALKTCLEKVNADAIQLNATIHAPRFGAGLAGGDWKIIEQIIKDTITVDVTIYDLK